jgi:hypothetical protein
MANAKQIDFLKAGILDAYGNPLSLGKVYTYEAGTSTPKACYTSADKTSLATNPIILDAYGQATVYGEGNYSLVIKTAVDITISTLHNFHYSIPTISNKMITSISADYSALNTDQIIKCNTAAGNITLNLPTAVGNSGREITVIKASADANTVILTPSGAETIIGSSSYTLSSAYDATILVSDGSGWQVESQANSGTVTLTGSQTLTNKVLTTPVLASFYQDAGKTKLISVPATNGITLASTADIATQTGPAIAYPNLTKYALPQGYMVNGKLSISVASHNITLALKGLDGNDPSATNPVKVRIGDSEHTVTTALSVTLNAGTSWMNLGSNELAAREVDVFAYMGYNATDGVVLGFSRFPDGRAYSDFSATATLERYLAVSTRSNAASTDYYEVVGRFACTLGVGATYYWSVPTYSALNLIQQPIRETRKLTWSPTITGFSGTPTTTAYYKLKVDEVIVDIYITGTSSATTFTFTLPIAGAYAHMIPSVITDNSVASQIGNILITNNNIATVYSALIPGGDWTNSGTKSLQWTLLKYLL